MKIYKLTGRCWGQEDPIGYYKNATDATKASREAISKYNEGVVTEVLEADVENVPMYASEYDITFIMMTVAYRGQIVIEECIGWYHGEPNAELTNSGLFGLKAEYIEN